MAPEDGRNDESAVDYRVREAVAVFDDHEDLVAAIEELEVAGFDRAQINLMTSRAAAEKKLGHAVKDIRELEDEPKVPLGGWIDRHELAEGRTALAVGLAYIGSFAAIGAVVATGGELAVVIAAAAAAGGSGGALGAWLGRRLGFRRAHELEEQLKQGGLLLWVQVRDQAQERKALDILGRHSTKDVHVHELTRRWGEEEVPMRKWQPDPFLAP